MNRKGGGEVTELVERREKRGKRASLVAKRLAEREREKEAMIRNELDKGRRERERSGEGRESVRAAWSVRSARWAGKGVRYAPRARYCSPYGGEGEGIRTRPPTPR